MTEPIVRVLRLVQFTGPRDKVEAQVTNSLHGCRDFGNGVLITAATIDSFPSRMDEEEWAHLADLRREVQRLRDQLAEKERVNG